MKTKNNHAFMMRINMNAVEYWIVSRDDFLSCRMLGFTGKHL